MDKADGTHVYEVFVAMLFLLLGWHMFGSSTPLRTASLTGSFDKRVYPIFVMSCVPFIFLTYSCRSVVSFQLSVDSYSLVSSTEFVVIPPHIELEMKIFEWFLVSHRISIYFGKFAQQVAHCVPTLAVKT